jgi:hypothetical protein
MTDRKKPTPAFWIAVALVAVLLGYPLSAGPGLWIAHHDIPQWLMNAICRIYAPVDWAEGISPKPIGRAIHGYLEFWVPKK